MTVSQENFMKLFARLASLDLSGTGPPDVPFQGDPPAVDSVEAAIQPAADRLPLLFRDAYIDPLESNLRHTLLSLQGDPTLVETVAGAIYDHGVDAVDPELDRFLAVISNLYRSFLEAGRRAAAGFPQLEEQLPPLAVFQHDGRGGPFTVPVDGIESLFEGTVGVVSLPSTYRDHSLLWASLAHETGGHDVLHADPTLLPELGAGIRAFFGGRLRPPAGRSRSASSWACCGATGWTRRPPTCTGS
jgi:hypothetical protein